MSNTKRVVYSKSCAVLCIVLGYCIALCPILILNCSPYSLVYLIILTTISAMNVIHVNRKTLFFPLRNCLPSHEESSNKEKSKRTEKKESSVPGVLVTFICSLGIYAIIAVLFGASLNEDFAKTLYFSSLMTVLTVYPLMLHFFSSESINTVLRIITDSKFENIVESHFQSLLIWTAVGAWIGAFPIPLDWDRPWQKWPTTCCIGASLGNSAVHLATGFQIFYSHFKDKRKVLLNRSV